jgi:hypothetical protein
LLYRFSSILIISLICSCSFDEHTSRFQTDEPLDAGTSADLSLEFFNFDLSDEERSLADAEEVQPPDDLSESDPDETHRDVNGRPDVGERPDVDDSLDGGFELPDDEIIEMAAEACDGLTEGDLCTIENDFGSIDGTCTFQPEIDLLICIPDNGPPVDPGELAAEACDGLSEEDLCTIENDFGSIDGTCTFQPEIDMLVCIPDSGPPVDPGELAAEACDGLSEEDLCTIENDFGSIDGTCTFQPEIDMLVCIPDSGPPVDPETISDAEEACEDLDLSDSCEYESDGEVIEGTCEEIAGGDSLICEEESSFFEDFDTSSAACEDLELGDYCEYENAFGTVVGTCEESIWGDELDCEEESSW